MSALYPVPEYNPRYFAHKTAMSYARRGKPWPDPTKSAAEHFTPTRQSMEVEFWANVFKGVAEILDARIAERAEDDAA